MITPIEVAVSEKEKKQTSAVKHSKHSTYSSEELLLNSDRSSSAEDLEEFPYSSGDSNGQNTASKKKEGDGSKKLETGRAEGDAEADLTDELGSNSGSLTLNTQCSNSENLLKCLFCDNHTNVATSRDAYLEHLKKTHRFIIANDHLIADFKKYIDYWRVKFAQKELTEFCSIIKTPMFPEDNGVPTMYLLLGDIPQDRRLREALQQKRLRLVLEQNQFERNDKTLNHSCVFCDMKFTNCNRSEIFEHMHSEHFFNVGHPDNLVFVNELLDVLHDAISRCQCLHCDNVYSDKSELFEHMKRKQHRKLNAKNTTYDKYYIINYLELGRSWEDIMADEDTEIWRELKREEYNWSDWKEDLSQFFVCLFCESQQDNPEKFKLHLQSHHNFNFDLIVLSFDYCFYDQVKMVNYIRSCVTNHQCHFCSAKCEDSPKLLDHFSKLCHDGKLPLSGCWNDDKFLTPVFENDAVFTLLKDVEDNVSVCEVEWIEKEDVNASEDASILQLGLDFIDENKLTAHTVTIMKENVPIPGATGDHLGVASVDWWSKDAQYNLNKFQQDTAIMSVDMYFSKSFNPAAAAMLPNQTANIHGVPNFVPAQGVPGSAPMVAPLGYNNYGYPPMGLGGGDLPVMRGQDYLSEGKDPGVDLELDQANLVGPAQGVPNSGKEEQYPEPVFEDERSQMLMFDRLFQKCELVVEPVPELEELKNADIILPPKEENCL